MMIFKKYFKICLLAILIIELLSWIVTGVDDLNKIFFAIILLITFILALKKLEWGIYIVLAELFIGSKGYLLEWPVGSFSVSLRLGLFLIVFLAFLVWVIREKKIRFFENKFWKYYIALISVMIFAVVIGYFRGNDLKTMFFDCNGYLYLGLILPITQAIVDKEKIYQVMQVLFGAVTSTIIKTLVLLFLFSQSNTFFYYLAGIYRWIRDSGVGEITKMDNGFYRIFFQSHIYVLIVFFIGLSVLSLNKLVELKNKKSLIIVTALSMLVVFLSYSRSFWVGSVFVLFVFFISLLFILKLKFKKVVVILGILILVFVADYGLALGIINFPLPGNAGVNAMSLISERTKDPTQEAAGSSRMNLLKPLLKANIQTPILGSGFGSTVTYETNDTRYLEMTGTSTYTAYAFEWGYLDLWLKLGLYGTVVYLLLIWQIFKTGYLKFKQEVDNKNKSILFGSLLGLIAICTIHFFTPYLNHPLGIGWILIISQYYNIKQ